MRKEHGRVKERARKNKNQLIDSVAGLKLVNFENIFVLKLHYRRLNY